MAETLEELTYDYEDEGVARPQADRSRRAHQGQLGDGDVPVPGAGSRQGQVPAAQDGDRPLQEEQGRAIASSRRSTSRTRSRRGRSPRCWRAGTPNRRNDCRDDRGAPIRAKRATATATKTGRRRVNGARGRGRLTSRSRSSSTRARARTAATPGSRPSSRRSSAIAGGSSRPRRWKSWTSWRARSRRPARRRSPCTAATGPCT